MELRVLHYFLTVAQEKTISKAAEVLHVSQPTLSKQLKDLEDELGVQLFQRGNRQITLTDEGIYLQNRGKEIFSLVSTTTSNLQKNDVIGGNIMIGSGETQAFHYISQILNNLIEKYPDINVHLHSGNADDIKDKLDKGLLDFGVVIDPVEKNLYDHFKLPTPDNWGILVNEHHQLAKNQVIAPSDLVAIPLVISSQSLVDNQLTNWFGGNLGNFNVVGTYNLLYNASLLIKEGNTAALCLDGIINTKESGLVFIPLSPRLAVNVNVIWKRNQIFSKAASLFLETLNGATL
ncbi:LysR family transcriptional regulator [Vagococcus sp. BWB3-3]|uniref:LysR family transcriptional regulator n=1 Tax=Vagococcus allomyrinae TaxID=2794353 RepID=A0A940SWR6_9ENTE|nr:LysR family transcriptional regulator [Vagococcus allomyrinae]MBP1042446.1 LysR family transcriptional regulator [Vagococcus allomyrinae]